MPQSIRHSVLFCSSVGIITSHICRHHSALAEMLSCEEAARAEAGRVRVCPSAVTAMMYQKHSLTPKRSAPMLVQAFSSMLNGGADGKSKTPTPCKQDTGAFRPLVYFQTSRGMRAIESLDSAAQNTTVAASSYASSGNDQSSPICGTFLL